LIVPSSARPTTDRVREALFNFLSARLDFDGLRVLDLYAGSGALGLEALSRGAASVLLVDSDRRAAEVITRNIAAVKLPGATVRRGPVASVLAGGASVPVDLVFADPPYDVTADSVSDMVAALSRHGWVGPGTVIVIERPVGAREVDWPAGWDPWPSRRYGDTRLEAAEVGEVRSGRRPPGDC
jgi:16S rRNA (guanine(966)-N(2))-methyltransferase RsmD